MGRCLGADGLTGCSSLLADHRPAGPGPGVPHGRGHGRLQHPPHSHHPRGHVPLLLHQLPLGLQPPPAAPQTRVRGQDELPGGRRAGEGTAHTLLWEMGARQGAAQKRGWRWLCWRGGNEVTSCRVYRRQDWQESRGGGLVLGQVLVFLCWPGGFDSHSQQPQSILAGPAQPVWTLGWSLVSSHGRAEIPEALAIQVSSPCLVPAFPGSVMCFAVSSSSHCCGLVRLIVQYVVEEHMANLEVDAPG